MRGSDEGMNGAEMYKVIVSKCRGWRQTIARPAYSVQVAATLGGAAQARDLVLFDGEVVVCEQKYQDGSTGDECKAGVP